MNFPSLYIYISLSLSLSLSISSIINAGPLFLPIGRLLNRLQGQSIFRCDSFCCSTSFVSFINTQITRRQVKKEIDKTQQYTDAGPLRNA